MEDKLDLCESFTSFTLHTNSSLVNSLPSSTYSYVSTLFKTAVYPIETILQRNHHIRRKDVYRLFGDLQQIVPECKEESISIDAVSSNVFLVRYEEVTYRLTLKEDQLIYEKSNTSLLEDKTYSQTFKLRQDVDRVDVIPYCYSTGETKVSPEPHP